MRGLFDWIAVKADGDDRASRADADALREAGFRVHVWEAEPKDGFTAQTAYGAGGYIAQSEGPGQQAAALAAGKTNPKALITNVNHIERWPDGWDALTEAYVNANPQATPAALEYEARKRGATWVSPCFGVYDATKENPPVGRKVPLREYLAMPGVDPKRFSVYAGEYFAQYPDDVAALRELRGVR